MYNENKPKMKVVYDESYKEKVIAPATDPKTKRKRTIVISSVSAFALALGIGGGIFMASFLNANKPNTSTATISERINDDSIYDSLETETKNAVKKYNEFVADKNVSELDLTKDFTPVELFMISNDIFTSHEKYMTQSFGVATAKMGLVDNKQSIFNCTIKENNKYFEESISSGSFISLARRAYEEGDSITTYDNGQVNSNESATYTTNKEGDKKVLSTQEYKKERGRTPSINGNYVISNETVNRENKFERNEDGTYLINLDMDLYKSTIMYRAQMKNISNLKALPEFDELNITINLDASLNLKSMHVKEVYRVNANMFANNVKNDATMDTYFYTNAEDISIPELNTPIKYIHNK